MRNRKKPSTLSRFIKAIADVVESKAEKRLLLRNRIILSQDKVGQIITKERVRKSANIGIAILMYALTIFSVQNIMKSIKSI